MVKMDSFDQQAIRSALEFIAANRADIEKAGELARSAPAQAVLRETEKRQRATARLIDEASKAAARSTADEHVRRQAQQAAYLRRALEPLDLESLARQTATMIRSDLTLPAKLLAADVLREAAEQRQRWNAQIADAQMAGTLVEQARRTFEAAGLQEADFEQLLPEIPPELMAYDAMAPGSERGRTPQQGGLEELITAVREAEEATRENTEATREEGERTRDALRDAAEPPAWYRDRMLLIALASLLVAVANTIVPRLEDPEPPPPPPIEITIEAAAQESPAADGEPVPDPAERKPPGEAKR